MATSPLCVGITAIPLISYDSQQIGHPSPSVVLHGTNAQWRSSDEAMSGSCGQGQCGAGHGPVAMDDNRSIAGAPPVHRGRIDRVPSIGGGSIGLTAVRRAESLYLPSGPPSEETSGTWKHLAAFLAC